MKLYNWGILNPLLRKKLFIKILSLYISSICLLIPRDFTPNFDKSLFPE